MRRAMLLLLAWLPTACVVQTETVQGETGPQGETGLQGQEGETGSQGPQGETGPQGTPGAPGVSPFAYVDATLTDIYYDSGLVGLGTNAPEAPAHIVGVSTSPVLVIEESGQSPAKWSFDTNASGLYLHHDTGLPAGTGPIAAAFDTNGKFGIGTPSPVSKLTVNGDISLVGGDTLLLGRDAFNVASTLWWVGKGSVNAFDGNQLALATSEAIPIEFATNNIKRVTISADGNVGVGSSVATQLLQVQGATVHDGGNYVGPAVFVRSTNATAPTSAILGLGVDNAANLYSIDTAVLIARDNGRLYLGRGDGGTGFVAQVVKDPDGNVGIGTTNPVATLDINGTARLAKYSSQPFPCDAAHDGTIALTSQRKLCVCDGSNWLLAAKDIPTQCW